MTRVTLEQRKESLNFQAADIEKLIERRLASSEDRQRLADIEEQLRIIASMEKPDSIAKKAKLKQMEVTHETNI